MLRLATKGNVPWFASGGGVHFRLNGELISFEDPDGRVEAMLRLMDGTRDVPDLHRALGARYPDLTLTELAEAVAELDAEGLVHDATDTGADFTPEERERWSRNLAFFETYASLGRSMWEPQRRIRDARLCLLGLGGIGSHALLDAVLTGFTDIRIVDFDTVELSNLNRQALYDETVLGRPKVEVAAERALALNAGVRIDPVQRMIDSPEAAYELVHDRDVVLVAVDRPKMHVLHWVNAGCVRAGASFLVGGVDGQRSFHYTVMPGVTGCLECWYATARAADPTSAMVFDVLEGMAAEGHTFSEDRSAFNGSVLPLVSGMMGDLVRLVTGLAEPHALARSVQVLFHDPQPRVAEAWERRADCATCRDATHRLPVRWAPAARDAVPA